MLFNRSSILAEKLSGVNTLIETGTGEILSDPKENGEERPWETKKPQLYKPAVFIYEHSTYQLQFSLLTQNL